MLNTVTGLAPNKITTLDPDTLLGQECELQDLDYSAYPNTPLTNKNVKNESVHRDSVGI